MEPQRAIIEDDEDDGSPQDGAIRGWFCSNSAHGRCKGQTGRNGNRRPCECLCHITPRVEHALSSACMLGQHDGCNGERRPSHSRHLKCMCPCHDAQTRTRHELRYSTDPVFVNRDDLEEEIQRVEISKLFLQGKHPIEIARQKHMDFDTVLAHLEVCRERWANLSLMDMDAAIREEIAKINHLESEYWAAWQESKVTILESGKGKGRKSISMCGDSTFLAGVLGCIDRRIKLMGLDAPIKIDITELIRKQAEAAGFDPDLSVQEAERLMGEMRLATR